MKIDLGMFKKQKTIEELEEEIRRKQLIDDSSKLDFSIAQKQEMLARLRAKGVKKSSIGGFDKVWEWLKTH